MQIELKYGSEKQSVQLPGSITWRPTNLKWHCRACCRTRVSW